MQQARSTVFRQSVTGANNQAIDVLHVAFTYFPDAVGGTEIYVTGLIEALQAYGIGGAVAAPGRHDHVSDHCGIPVFRFAQMREPRLESAYGEPDEDAARAFQGVLSRTRPRIVHLHARTAAISERIIEASRAAGANVIFTYHTPTVSCLRGTLMRLGQTPCDGRLDADRCANCVLQSHGVSPLMRKLLVGAPRLVAHALERARLQGGPFTAARIPAMVDENHRRFRWLLNEVDHVVAVCHWNVELLRANGCPESKLTLCRQGLGRRDPARKARSSKLSPSGDNVLRLGYFGRLEAAKGVDILIEALRRTPDAPAQLDIYGVRQPGCEEYTARLEKAATQDRRIAFWPALDASKVVEAMAGCDFVAVPSRGLETGPLVALEAFAAGTPVLGARLGGIAEIVRDGIDGLLVAPDDAAAWSGTIADLTRSPAKVAQLREGVRPPRTMDQVAREMAALYEAVLAR